MQVVSNSMPGAISPWAAWQMLFNPHQGDEAVIFTGYLSGGEHPNTWCTDIINDMVDWLQHPRAKDALPRRLSIHVGRWKDNDSYVRSVDMLGRILAHIKPHYRQHVSIHDVPKLHVKAFAIYAGEPGTGSQDCIRLLCGSSNLTYASMAAGNNIELDAYLCAPTDSSALQLYGAALRDVELQCTSSATYDQAANYFSLLNAGTPLIARRVYSDDPDRQSFYSDVENAMLDYESRLVLSQVQADDEAMQSASDECLRSDTNS